jgi:hypothetical protein
MMLDAHGGRAMRVAGAADVIAAPSRALRGACASPRSAKIAW